ncbi:NAD(P)/FAD-dependent oxidoreductase [Xanthomonas hyacinthi]|uniref:NAD(P)/FAD-dependent oxidoreductase n=1 Tax=Xanthomonas hyacinthi TaxID=56455 RepID=A0A2S7EU41_9XANT|nr:FAD/NAD(P)-binding oxidoreductase [Xanthomonas hyacinthi]KLD79593.1 oxidoreductase [Xanthomonas hyacinthi DSM 19077]PPU96651.1 NAD(P)/FAD-dependent oxidoreductase [Xanthomonas hyacinthi]QGY75568.1 NAD(P)/FAD-dependent oxidoreductase [Xanthomonas hyacinthi]
MAEPRALQYDVVVAGAGPAGLAAALAAAGHGRRVALVDLQARAGGQIWRHDVTHAPPRLAARVLAQLAASRIDFLAQTQLLMAQDRQLLADGPQGARWIGYDALVLATGARELLLPFPGWTLPGVTGAGGAQALAKQGWPLAGKRVLVAGSGPLLLASAATLRRHGAQVLGIVEQAPLRALAGFAAQLPWRWPDKALQALSLRAQLAGVRYHSGSVVLAAQGDGQLQSVEIDGPRGRRSVECDQLAVGYGLVPNVELAQLLGCRLARSGAHPCVAVDAQLRTSVAGVYAAGEALGIGGRDCARVEGAITGHLAAGQEAAAQALQPQRHRARAFAALLQRQFALDPRIHALAADDTLVCRCEDVPLSALRGHADLREAKLVSRCGMGACQGRICGSALTELGLAPRHDDFSDDGRRPPLFPVRLDALAQSLPDPFLSEPPLTTLDKV